MDLNYLFFRQQVERSRQSSSQVEAVRRAHREMAEAYEDAIRRVTANSAMFRDRDGVN